MGFSEMIPREAEGPKESHISPLNRCSQGMLGHWGNQVKILVWVKKRTAQKSSCELSSWQVNTFWQVGGVR